MRRTIIAAIAIAAIATVACARDFPCLVAGDSIAIDVGLFAPASCRTNAKIGIGSDAIVPRVAAAELVVISAGSNDPDNPRLADNLAAMRARAGGARIVWVIPVCVPAHRALCRAARLVAAAARRDRAVAFAPAGDHVHPKCPRCLAREIFGR